MESTPQSDNQTVAEHGRAVWEKSLKILSGQFEGMRIPDWFQENHVHIVNNVVSTWDFRMYNEYHDCGKPYCIEYDDEGRRHFPNHAEVSARTYLKHYPVDDKVAELIRNDMLLHTVTSDKLKEMLSETDDYSQQFYYTLMVTALAELHANADMFGGIESTSFKSKWKKWNRRAKQIFNHFHSEQYKRHSYIVVRNDLGSTQTAVQASHAAIELGRSIGNHPSLVIVVVKNEKKLKSVIEELHRGGIDVKIFRDNLFNDEITAIATAPLDESRRRALSRFQLLK